MNEIDMKAIEVLANAMKQVDEAKTSMVKAITNFMENELANGETMYTINVRFAPGYDIDSASKSPIIALSYNKIDGVGYLQFEDESGYDTIESSYMTANELHDICMRLLDPNTYEVTKEILVQMKKV
jgi:hypothetical protein